MLLQDLFRDKEDVVTVRPDDTICHATMRMKEENVGAVVVTDEDERVVGILTDRDVALSVVLTEAPSDTPVSDVMTKGCPDHLGRPGCLQCHAVSLRAQGPPPACRGSQEQAARHGHDG